MLKIDLTPFGFTPTESLVYAVLLELGPSTGYAVARAARLARANAYGALEGLVRRGGAAAAAGRPVRYRPTDPTALVARLAAEQGEALDRLARALRDTRAASDGETRPVAGARAVANLVQQLVARAEKRVEGVVAAELWKLTLPAWRRAAARAEVAVRVAGEVPDSLGLTLGSAAPDTPTVLVVDGAQVLLAAGEGDALAGLWSSHPLIARMAIAAMGGLG